MESRKEKSIDLLAPKIALNENAQFDFEIWQKVNEVKHRFFAGKQDPRKSPYIPIEVAESWIRSKNYGVDPYKSRICQLPAKESENLLKSKQLLIQTAVPLMKKYLSLLSTTGYGMLLTDEKGVVLHNQSNNPTVSALEFGTILSEQTFGTTAHSLCGVLKKPVQFIGSYNYCVELEQNIVSSTPIFDCSGQLTGTLTIYQLLVDAGRDTYNMQVHSLGWITSMATAIENQMQLQQANRKLCLSNGTLEAILSVVEEGIITLNKQGVIVQINDEGCNIIGTNQNAALGQHYTKFLKEKNITKTLRHGKPINNQDITITGNGVDRQYIMRVNPVTADEAADLIGAVIYLSKIESIKKLVNEWRGANAKYSFEDILGKNQMLRRTIDLAKRYALVGANILIEGESGTGKELFAHAIHNESRPDGPFIAINCSAMPRDLIESELFGYEGGAFTGAERKGRPGLVELANGGTLFLDEIGDMPLELQPVLLRVIENKRVMRVGGKKYIPVDFRVISATNSNLSLMVQKGTFREDLYYRLAVVKLQIPPLRIRRDDIYSLANYFIKNISLKIGCFPPRLSSETIKIIEGYHWPGNVRQLENAMVCAVSLAREGIIEPSNLPDEIIDHVNPSNLPFSDTTMSLTELEIAAIRKAMKQMNNNVEKASKVLGIGKSTLYKKLKLYNIPY
jgi:transcriptional regulator with PAS, ATPase and Fis domain